MKLLSVAIPCYNSQDYLARAVDSLLPGGESVEILIIDDGSGDSSGAIADEYALKHPSIVRTIHKPNGGHGDAVMTALHAARGAYFKVVDSDDWVDVKAYLQLLERLAQLNAENRSVDLFVSNYVYDKACIRHRRVIRYTNALPTDRVLSWDDAGRFRIGQYILMHAIIYRTQLLRSCGIRLPKHTFYVDNLYAYVPLLRVQSIYYMDVDLYHYFIGREDQSVQERVMIQRIDQQIKVNLQMAASVRLCDIDDPRKRRYMRNYLEIITAVSCVLLLRDGSAQALEKKRALWQTLKDKAPENHRMLRYRPMGLLLNTQGRAGRGAAIGLYRMAQRLFGFN